MAIPDYQTIMLPLLRFAGDNKEHSLSETIKVLADAFELSDEERTTLLPSRKQPTFSNRVGWAKTYLKKAGLLEKTKRAHFKITARGKSVLEENLSEIKVPYLTRFDDFQKFYKNEPTRSREETNAKTPEETLEESHQVITDDLSAEILETITRCSPEFFEQLVVDLLLKMGYGGSRKEAGQAIGKSGDGGVDGIIKEDRLGLDVIYIQAKRWGDTSVGRPEIQKFVGALHGNQAKKGIFFTTSTYTAAATEYVAHIDPKIILIDGGRLAELMIEHNVGVTPIACYEVKRLDSDYFCEE